MERICFIHAGRAPFLRYAVAQAQQVGLSPLVIGDEEAVRDLTCECHPISRFDASAREFAEIYRHVGVNPELYELFCIQRWFILDSFMQSDDVPIWMADHDILVYDGLPIVAETIRSFPGPQKPMMNSAWFAYVHARQNLQIFLDHVVDLYRDAAAMDEAALRHAIDGRPHLSDMHLLIDCSRRFPERFIDTAYGCSRLGLDINIRNIDGFEAAHGHKRIAWAGDVPHTTTAAGQAIRMISIHLQGPSKYLMQKLNTIDEAKRDALPDFARDVRDLPDDAIGTIVKRAYLASDGRDTLDRRPA